MGVMTLRVTLLRCSKSRLDLSKTFRFQMRLLNALVFLMRVSGTIEVPTASKTIDDLLIKPRTSIDQTKTQEYAKLFYCAQAMLAGVKVDPRVQAA